MFSDKEGRPTIYVTRDVGEALAKGVEEAEVLQGLYIDKPVDLVIVSSSGYYFDIDLHQALKAVIATCN